MSLPRCSLAAFLRHAKASLGTCIEARANVTFVIGNESADLDSMSSSIIYAYVRSMSPPENAFSQLYIPVTNIPASDIRLRPEYSVVFKHANIQPSQLITLDDLPPVADMQAKLAPENTKWILVDHNCLMGEVGRIYGRRVAGVIDHHEDEHAVPEDTGEEPRVVRVSGSCSSLVTNFVQPMWDNLPGPSQATETAADVVQWDAEVAQLGLASILIDTHNLEDQTKTTEEDVLAAKYLIGKISLDGKVGLSFQQKGFFRDVQTAKKDIGTLRVDELLRKDYKQWADKGIDYGISTLTRPLEFLHEKAKEEAGKECHGKHALLDVVEQFAKRRGLDLYVAMCTYSDAKHGHSRQLFIWALNQAAVAKAKKFVDNSREELGLEKLHKDKTHDLDHGHADSHQWRRGYQQRQVQHSRKRVAPLLKEAMM